MDVLPQWIAAHARLKNEFTEGDKCHNLMSQLNYTFDKLLIERRKNDLSRLMRLWHLSPSVNSIFKHACAAIHCGYTSVFWSDPSSTSILYVCEQRRLWRDGASACAFAVRLCDKYHNLMSWLIFDRHI